MPSSTIAGDIVRLWAPNNLRKVAPGVALCAAIAAIAYIADKQDFLRFGAVWIPPLILTLVIGMALQPLSNRATLKPGLEFAGRTLLRVGVALYGARLTFGQLVDGGLLPVLIALAAARPRQWPPLPCCPSTRIPTATSPLPSWASTSSAPW